ncbi:hypothetical protein Tco_0327669 [Tanacetum coccineum]
MDDEPMWSANRVVAPTPGSAITIPDTANEFAIKVYSFPPAFFDQLLGEIRAFSQHENETLTEAWLCMKEMLRNCHGHNLSKGNILKIFYHSVNEITQEVLNAAASGIFLYKTPNQAYQPLEDKVLLNLDWAKNQKTKSSLKKIVSFADESSSNSDTNKIMARTDARTMKIDAQYKEFQSRSKQPNTDHNDDDTSILTEKQFGRPSGSLPSNTQPNLKGSSSKPYQPPQARNEHVKAVFKRSGKSYDPPINPNDQPNDPETPIIFDKEDFDALLHKGSKILYSIKGTILEEKLLAEFDEFMAMTTKENYKLESDTKESPFEKITFNTDYKIKTSLEEPPMDLELKPLHDNL